MTSAPHQAAAAICFLIVEPARAPKKAGTGCLNIYQSPHNNQERHAAGDKKSIQCTEVLHGLQADAYPGTADCGRSVVALLEAKGSKPSPLAVTSIMEVAGDSNVRATSSSCTAW